MNSNFEIVILIGGIILGIILGGILVFLMTRTPTTSAKSRTLITKLSDKSNKVAEI